MNMKSETESIIREEDVGDRADCQYREAESETADVKIDIWGFRKNIVSWSIIH
jgi:hypothetical protein